MLQDKPTKIINGTYRTLLKEAQTILTICYVLSVGIGMLFTFQKYSEFGINIFDYADVFYFLIAPFSDLKIFLFIIVSLAVSIIFYGIDSFWRRKFPKSYSKMLLGMDDKIWYRSFRQFLILCLFLIYLFIAANRYGAISRNRILKQAPVSIRFYDNEIKKGKMIGKANDFIFFWIENKVAAIPITTLVKEIEIIQ